MYAMRVAVPAGTSYSQPSAKGGAAASPLFFAAVEQEAVALTL